MCVRAGMCVCICARTSWFLQIRIRFIKSTHDLVSRFVTPGWLRWPAAAQTSTSTCLLFVLRRCHTLIPSWTEGPPKIRFSHLSKRQIFGAHSKFQASHGHRLKSYLKTKTATNKKQKQMRKKRGGVIVKIRKGLESAQRDRKKQGRKA